MKIETIDMSKMFQHSFHFDPKTLKIMEKLSSEKRINKIVNEEKEK